MAPLACSVRGRLLSGRQAKWFRLPTSPEKTKNHRDWWFLNWLRGAFTQMRCRCFQPHVVGAYILTGQINPILGQLMALCHANSLVAGADLRPKRLLTEMASWPLHHRLHVSALLDTMPARKACQSACVFVGYSCASRKYPSIDVPIIERL